MPFKLTALTMHGEKSPVKFERTLRMIRIAKALARIDYLEHCARTGVREPMDMGWHRESEIVWSSSNLDGMQYVITAIKAK